jgi:hypothetical protein
MSTGSVQDQYRTSTGFTNEVQMKYEGTARNASLRNLMVPKQPIAASPLRFAPVSVAMAPCDTHREEHRVRSRTPLRLGKCEGHPPAHLQRAADLRLRKEQRTFGKCRTPQSKWGKMQGISGRKKLNMTTRNAHRSYNLAMQPRGNGRC